MEFERQYDEEKVRKMLLEMDAHGIGKEMRLVIELTEKIVPKFSEQIMLEVAERCLNDSELKPLMIQDMLVAHIGGNLIANSGMPPVLIKEILDQTEKHHKIIHEKRK